MKIIVTESHYNLALYLNQVLTENVDIEGYNYEDFIEVFLLFFRPWIKKTHGDEIGIRPFSYLVEKYLNDFCEDFDVKSALSSSRYYSDNLKKLAEVGKELVKKGKHILPTLRSERKFTEQHKRGLDVGIKMLNLPDYVTLEITEEKPYSIEAKINVDFLSAIKDVNINGNPIAIAQRKVTHDLVNFIEMTMGIPKGNPVKGGLEFYGRLKIVGYESWLKEFNKTVKKEMSSKFSGYRQMKVNLNNNKVMIKLGFTRNAFWSTKREVKEYLTKRIEELGYNTNVFDIEN
jgi:hypothetical protein